MFICSIHGKYSATKQSNNCPKCPSSNKQLEALTVEFIIKARKIHKNKYDYSGFIFIDYMTAGIIRCKKHGNFDASPAVHIFHKFGCPKCSGSISKGEIEWLDYLGISERNNILVIGKKSIRPDGIDRAKKIVYEFYGDYWHGNPEIYNPKEKNVKAKKTFGKLYEETIKREELIKSAGYKLVKIWETEWENKKGQLKTKKKKK